MTAKEALTQAGQEYADFFLRSQGNFPPTAFIKSRKTPDALIMFVHDGQFDTVADKDRFVWIVRAMCVVHDAEAVVILSEAWVTLRTVKPGTTPREAYDQCKELPSEAPDRKEVVMMAGEDIEGEFGCLLYIKREDGKFAGFEPDKSYADMKAVGRFQKLLLREKADPAMMMVAKKLVETVKELSDYKKAGHGRTGN
jgi:hypothetical protein